MSTEEKFCLKWNDFKENVASAFGSLRSDNDYTDVTLVCDDDHQIEAHKVILVSSSPFFQSLFKRNKHANPLIYMRGLKSHDILAIVDFMYYGEANIYQDNLDSFLSIAEELDLKGLTRSNNDGKNLEEIPNMKNVKTPKHDNKIKERNVSNNVQRIAESNESKASPSNEGVIALPKQEFSGDFQELNEIIKTMMVLGDNFTSDGKQKAWVYQVGGK